KKIKKISGGIGIDYLSGNTDKTKVGDNNNFNTLYATNHKFYGYMDYFLNIPGDTKQRGLMDIYAKVGFYPSKKINTYVTVHYFSFANENKLGAKKIGQSAGTETDFILNYKISPITSLQAGYSMMFATQNMELVKGGNANQFNSWAYLMLKITPTFFHHKFNG
ncbi:MAG: hypothetical protein IT256_00620, partial [Chitinophagaceae bacterium]|nr:hypothetical protein [Chitinophagaceae bacterium]